METHVTNQIFFVQVLNVLENIKEESTRDVINTSARQNLCYALADALESLEQEVNNSLLHLVLEVSS